MTPVFSKPLVRVLHFLSIVSRMWGRLSEQLFQSNAHRPSVTTRAGSSTVKTLLQRSTLKGRIPGCWAANWNREARALRGPGPCPAPAVPRSHRPRRSAGAQAWPVGWPCSWRRAQACSLTSARARVLAGRWRYEVAAADVADGVLMRGIMSLRQ